MSSHARGDEATKVTSSCLQAGSELKLEGWDGEYHLLGRSASTLDPESVTEEPLADWQSGPPAV